MDDKTVPIDPEGIYAGPSDDEYKYRLIAELGSGGEGTVWRAEVRPELGLPHVAVKVDLEQPGEEAAFASRSREWADQRELLLHLRHPAVVRVRDTFVAAAPHRPGDQNPGRASYLVMNLVEGVSLAIWAAKEPLTLGDALAKLTAAGAGVSYLHSGTDTAKRPIIHRDLKPANIMVQSDGGVVIVDFGLARGAGLPPRGGGTRGYQAPEVAWGDYGIPSDLFAFAGVAYFLFVGDNPPENNDLNVMRQQLSGTESLRHQPRVVEHLLLGRDPDLSKRPSDVSAWLSGFSTSLTTRSVVDSHYPPPPPEPPPPLLADQDPPPEPLPTPVPPQRRRGRWLISLFLILALGAAGLYRASPWIQGRGPNALRGGPDSAAQTPQGVAPVTTTTAVATTTTQPATTTMPTTTSTTVPPTTTPQPTTIYLDTISPAESNGWSGKGKATVAGTDYNHAIWDKTSACAGDLHYVEYALDTKFATFTGMVGLRNDSQSVARVAVQISIDGTTMLDKEMTLGTADKVSYNVAGKQRIRFQAKQTYGTTDCSFGSGNNRLVVANPELKSQPGRTMPPTTLG